MTEKTPLIETIKTLAKLLGRKSDDSPEHIERISGYSELLARKLCQNGFYPEILDEDYISAIKSASPLHDIGKILIDGSILFKPGRLTRDEFNIMKTHSEIGFETLTDLSAAYPDDVFLRVGLEITRYHHEKWDGSGYPFGLAGDAVPLSARIMAVSDTYDVLRSIKPYKEPYSHDESVEIVGKAAGVHFDSRIVDLFLGSHDEFDELYKTN